MPRGSARCPSCDLSVAEALQRSDKPKSEQPPLALYEGPPPILSVWQQMVIGGSFFAGIWFALFQNWPASICCFVALWCLTPASAEFLADRLFANRLNPEKVEKLGAVIFFIGSGLGLFGS